jgi:EmrB/QacA subfamily drug resistance transporter
VDEGHKPAELVPPQNRALIFVAALASVFITAVESTIVATAMPTIVATLGGFDLLSWVFTAYLLTQAITIPIYSRLSDLYGRKPLLLVGIGLFVVGSVLCGFAWNMLSLVVFRIVQGLGAGALTPVSRTLIGDIYHGADRARMQGYVSSVFVGAAVLGPVIGAFLAAHTIWAMVFWINIPIALLAGAILIWTLHEQVERRRHRIDWGGSVLIGLGIGLLMFALAQTASLGLGFVLGLMAVALVLLMAFVLYEQRVAEPIWPMSLWRDGIANRGNLVSLGLGASMMGIAAYLPVYMQGAMGTSAFVTGLALMAMSAAGPIGAVLAGRIMLRASYRISATAGAIVYIAGSVMMTALDPQSGAVWAMMSGFLMGFGTGMSNNTYMVAIQADSGWSQRGIATGAFLFSRILGQALGTAAFGGILNSRLADYLMRDDDLVSRITSPEFRRSLAPEIAGPLMLQFNQALHTIFLILVAVSVAVMVVGLTLPRGRGLGVRP